MSFQHRQSGLSLIEVMVSITAGLILLAGVIQLFTANKHAYRVQEGQNFLQENGRFALQFLEHDLRMADHWGGVEASDVSGAPTLSGVGGCSSAWITSASVGLMGYEGGATNPLPAGCLSAADYVANSDVLVVRYADTDGIVPSASLNANTVYVRSAVGGQGQVFIGSSGAPVALPDEDGTYNFPYRIAAYFVRPCSTKAGAACASTDDGGSPIPTLTRFVLNGTSLTQEPLVEGIEQLQLEYGEDTNNDEMVDIYRTAASVSNWGKVLSVRLSLIARSSTRDAGFSDSLTYSLAGGYSYTPASADQSYYRKPYTKVVQVRNRVRK